MSAGPFPVLIGFLVLPIIWGFPVALLAAELSTALPCDSSFTAWVQKALGDVAAFTATIAAFISGVVDMTLYPNIMVRYLILAFDYHAESWATILLKGGVVTFLCLLNAAGIRLAADASMLGTFILLLPFAVLTVVGIPTVDPSVWLQTTPDFNLVTYLNIMLWNLGGWDSFSNVAGNIVNPGKTVPQALFLAAVILEVFSLLPILVISGNDSHWASYTNGHFMDVANQVGGEALRFAMAAGAIVYCCTMYCYRVTAFSHQLEGMALQGLAPRLLAFRLRRDLIAVIAGDRDDEALKEGAEEGAAPPVTGSPIVAIGFVWLISLAACPFAFGILLKVDNVLYCIVLLAMIVSFIILRRTHPDMHRPFKIPLGTVGCALIFVPPALIAILLIVVSGLLAQIVSAVVLSVAAISFQFMSLRLRPMRVVPVV
eukprot:CAMPEP_0114539270 /NCGR_PEP_ID=MMETSP0114-20121206/148_1 /TAXON_ID=31324 /ORGANISM="Goniomonas sp, Strain m" /LENGTH=428 /DNA_ID=CAMNT_0001723361 /DNA_START=150 /DNA_END=1436 /DNA_ORIENTATION=-